jgi:hypothetical protein
LPEQHRVTDRRFPPPWSGIIDRNQLLRRENRIRSCAIRPPIPLPERTVVDSFAFQIDWITLCAAIGLLVSLVAVFVTGIS